VPEESHLEEMRAAIRGDRERNAQRSQNPPVLPPPVTQRRPSMLERLRRVFRPR
jgi:hypothetical protein